MSDDDDTLTGADVFGEPGTPSERVTHREPSHLRGYRARRRWVRRSDNKWVHVQEPDDVPEPRLPDDYGIDHE